MSSNFIYDCRPGSGRDLRRCGACVRLRFAMHQDGDGSQRVLTWSVLLAKWTEFAKASTVLPDEGDAGRVKRNVAAIIGLQAVTCALGEIDSLAADERAAGIDLAAVQIRSLAAQLNEAWRGEVMRWDH